MYLKGKTLPRNKRQKYRNSKSTACIPGLILSGIIVAILDRLLEKGLARGWASLFVAVLFMGGIQLVSLGIIGEYLGRIYTEVKHRPLYAIQERLGFDESMTGTENQNLKSRVAGDAKSQEVNAAV